MKSLFLTTVLLGTAVLSGAAVEKCYEFEGSTGLPAKALKGKAEFVPGVRGKGLKLANSTLTIPCPGKVTPEEGTISFWIKPVNWDSKKDEFVFFVQNVNKEKNGRLIFYKYSGKAGLGTTLWYGDPDGKKGVGNRYASTRRKDEMEQGKWYFLAATWSKKSNLIRAYINGKEVASCACTPQMFFKKFGDFVLNPPPFRPANRKYETVFDQFRIHSKALTEQELGKLYSEDQKPVLEIPLELTRPSFITVPVMKNLPRIDGNFEAAEWADAAKFGGFIELRTPRLQTDPDTVAYLGSDKKNFYFCFVGKIPGGTQLVNKKTERDSSVYTDDAFEIYVRPPEMDMGFYQAIINYAGAIFDTRNSDAKWNGKWQIKNGIYEGQWICEVAIPISELASSFRENAIWKFNLCRDRQRDPDIVFSSVSSSGMPFRAYFADFRTSEKGAFGRLNINYDRLFERKLDLSLEVTNQAAQKKSVTFEVTMIDPSGKVTAKKVQRADIAGKQAHTFKFTDPLAGFRAGIVRIDAVADGKEQILRQDLPLIFKDEVAITTNTDLAKARLSFEIDLKSHYKLAGTRTVRVKFRDKTGKELICTAQGNPLAKGAFDLKKVTPGDCDLILQFLDKNNQLLLEKKEFYSHIGQPRWLVEKPGANAGVVFPYTPIKLKGSTLSVIGREHVMGKSLFPDQITSNGIRLFTAKPLLKAKINGKQVTFNNFKFTPVKVRDAEVDYRFTAAAGGLGLEGTLHVEFDGFFWYSFKLDQKSMKLEELFLEMQLPTEIAELYNAHFFSRENYVGKVKPPMQIRQIPSLWIGNTDVGLTLATESFESWKNKNTLKAFHFFKRNNSTVWQIRLIDKVTDPGKKQLKYEFGLQANPVKPVRKDFRSWRVHAHFPSNIVHPWQVSTAIRKYKGHNGTFTPEFVSLDAFKAEVKRFRDQGTELSLYINPTLTSPDTTEYKIFRKEWRNPYNVYPQCPASTLTDLTMSQIDYLIREGGLKIVYVDSLGAVNCANPLHGCGYIDENGTQKLTWPIRATREYMKRLYSMLHAPGSDPKVNFLWAHMSARTCAPINAFVDFQASGEELETRISENQNYLELYGLDEYQCYYMNSSGVMPMLLPNLGRIGTPQARWMSKYNDQLLSLVMLHDSMLWIAWCDTNYMRKFYQIIDAFGYKDPALEFLSYRKQKAVTCKEPDIHTSIYRLGKKAMAFTVNKQKTARTVTLEIDYKKLGIPAGAALKDMRTGKKLPSGKQLKLTIPGYNFALTQIGE